MNKRTPPRTPKSSGNSDKSGRWAPSTSGPSRSERRPDQKPRGNASNEGRAGKRFSNDRDDTRGNDGKPNNPYNKRSSSRTDTRADKQMDASSSQRPNAPSGQRRGYKGAVKADEPRTSRPPRPPVITERAPTTPEGNRAKKSSRGRKHSRGPSADTPLLYGTHAVEAALANPNRRVEHLWVTEKTEKLVQKSAASDSIPCEIVDGGEIGSKAPEGAVHQSIIARVEPLEDLAFEDICETAQRVVLLDQVTDPHNVGAIFRSAAVFGFEALITTERNSPAPYGVLAKSASGAVEHVPYLRVTNLARAIEMLQAHNFTVIGLDGDANNTIAELDTSGKTALVMGAEGDGLRRLTREKCDFLGKLPASGPLRSLNVSNAAAVAFYEVARSSEG